MLQTIEQINNVVNNFIWGVPAMICIIGVGLFLSVRTRFLQIRKFPYAMKVTIGRMLKKREASDGALTPFQAVCTALAATVGTGNVAGVAGAIAIGGPGAVFWMWISAILGMCTKFSEVTLAVHFRETNANGELVGGPMYYIKNGLSKKWHFLAYLFAAFGVLTVFGTGNATQVNTITTAVNSALMNYHVISKDAVPTSNLIQGIIIAALVALILLGGVKRIAQVTEKLVPFMALFYIVLAIGVILLNLNRIPSVFVSILEGAFRPSAVTGGIVGSMLMSVKKGVSRGIFSNESGLGSAPIAAAAAQTKEPVRQGLVSMTGTFIDTIIICTMTGLTIIVSGVWSGDLNGAAMTQSAFTMVFPVLGNMLLMIGLVLFAFTTILGWNYYGERCIAYLLGVKAIIPYRLFFIAMVACGAFLKLEMIWIIADIANGLMALPNLIALLLLTGVIVKETKLYFKHLDENKDYKFNLFGQDIVKSGRYLMNHGLTVKLEGDYASLVLYIKEV